MSSSNLTNPNELVTKQMLNDYHETILPYLGGMPSMVANKFDKGNLYSIDEKMIGQWIDGKPLYQRVFELSNAISVSSSVVTRIPSISANNFSRVFDCVGFSQNDDFATPLFVTCETSDTDIGVKSLAGTSLSIKYIIIKYTKITDSAIAIGSDTDYSTDEKIIGTWIDSKPIYQQSIQITSDIVLTTKYTGVFTVPSNISKVISLQSNYQLMLFLAYPNPNNVGEWAMADVYGIVIPSGTIVTLQYTKTTN